MTQELRLTIYTGQRPLTLNAERRQHKHQRAKTMRQWHQATHEALLEHGKTPTWQAIEVTAQPAYPNAQSIPDTGAITPTVKAIVDALVHARICPEDNRHHYRLEAHRPPQIDRNLTFPVVDILVKSVPPAEGHETCECGNG